ncbi:hypothetical protein L1049_026977 [Liquidambar formosana]|uniref:Uncharacterized protein n=1 Tax=Liquidambar formosana TaxID=63359 RepID=A0AAP0NFW2_LIQFO
MDREQEEMQFLGLWGIYTESYKIIFSWRKIFSKITLALILPLSFIFLAHIEVSELLFSKIIHNEIELDETRANTPKYDKISDVLSSEWTTFWLFKFVYFTCLLVFSLLSTAAVVYTIACIYTGREVTFKKVMSVVPKVWKRLMVTFLCIFVAVFVYNMIASSILNFMGSLYRTEWGRRRSGSVHIVHSVRGGFRVHEHRLAIGERGVRVGRGVRGSSHEEEQGADKGENTVIYFVCKSYHHENIDKSTLSDHLEVYLGEYVPLKSKDVQLEQFDV